MSIKLIAVDIDGTLVNSKKEITPEVFAAIQDAKKAGVKVMIATGRPIAGVAKLLDDLKLRDEGDYVVTFNGALVQETATGHEIISESLTYEDYLDMEFLSRKLGVHMHAITKDGIYTANRNIGKYTVHESTLVSQFSTVHLKKWLTRKSSNVCLSMSLKFSMPLLKRFLQNFTSATPSTNLHLSTLSSLKRM